MAEKALPTVLKAPIDQFAQWLREQQQAEQDAASIKHPLYHYTNASGLRGILESQKIWFTSYLYLNDPSELAFGMSIVRGLLQEIAAKADDGLIKLFCDMVDDLFQQSNFDPTFGFYIASLSREGDDLGQWRAYADNGRGVALGLAPDLFQVVDTPHPRPDEYFVMPVEYGEKAAQARFRPAIKKAAAIIQENRPYLSDKSIGIPFLREMANELMAGWLISGCLTVKHPAYSHENEVRLVILGQRGHQKPYVKTRVRGSEIVPFIEGDMPLRDKNGVVEVVVGPAAGPVAKDAVRSLLESFGVAADDRIRASGIPYRAL